MSASNSFHRQNDVSCTSCHSMHHAKTREHMLVKAEPELCYSCHLQQRAQFNMPFRHRVNEGLIQCTDCHNQHGTGGVLEGDHLVRQVRTSASGDMVCFKCHADKQGPFVFEHAAARLEGCGSCHIAHGGGKCAHAEVQQRQPAVSAMPHQFTWHSRDGDGREPISLRTSLRQLPRENPRIELQWFAE